MKHDPNDPLQMVVEGKWLSLSDIQKLSEADLQALFPPIGFTVSIPKASPRD